MMFLDCFAALNPDVQLADRMIRETHHSHCLAFGTQNLGVFHIYPPRHSKLKGAKWFLTGVNIPSLTVSLASLERCWYVYMFSISILPPKLNCSNKSCPSYSIPLPKQNHTWLWKKKHWVNIWINQWFDDVVVEPGLKIPWWKEKHYLRMSWEKCLSTIYLDVQGS